jgi:hypothetical protein
LGRRPVRQARGCIHSAQMPGSRACRSRHRAGHHAGSPSGASGHRANGNHHEVPRIHRSHRHRSRAYGHRSGPPREAAGAGSRSDPGRGGVLAPVARAGTAMIRAAAVLAWFTGFGFGLPGSYAIWYLGDRGHIWTFLGFPTTAGGRLRTSGSRPPCRCLSCSYWSAWPSSRRDGCCGSAGAVLALLPTEFAFWIGFALPLGPVAGLARTVLVLRGWSSLSRRQAQPTGRPADAPPAINQRPG